METATATATAILAAESLAEASEAEAAEKMATGSEAGSEAETATGSEARSEAVGATVAVARRAVEMEELLEAAERVALVAHLVGREAMEGRKAAVE